MDTREGNREEDYFQCTIYTFVRDWDRQPVGFVASLPLNRFLLMAVPPNVRIVANWDRIQIDTTGRMRHDWAIEQIDAPLCSSLQAFKTQKESK